MRARDRRHLRVLIDVLGAPAESGGMQLYAEELIRAWSLRFPEDEIVVSGGSWIESAFANYPNVTPRVFADGNHVVRIWNQLISAGIAYRRMQCNVGFSVSSVLSPLVPRRDTYVVIHDWRHMHRSGEFSFTRKLYRRLWRWCLERARVAFAISDKTRRETARFAPAAHCVVVANGEDHPSRWALSAAGTADTPQVVTFGHHPNKRPGLVVEAFAGLPSSTRGDLQLCVLGVTNAELRAQLERVAARLGVLGQVQVLEYVSDDRYQRAVSGARVVVLASSDEGFGLPVVEARYFGVPVVVTSDNGLSEIHEDVIEARPDAPSLTAALELGLTRGATGQHGTRTTPRPWSAVAEDVRDTICSD